MNWPTGKVADIATVISGYAFKSEWFGSGATKIIRIGNLQNNKITDDDTATFDSETHSVSQQFKIVSGDILMALSGATVGKIAVAEQKDAGSYLNQRVAIVRGKTIENSAYLKYIFSGLILQNLLMNAGGAAQPNLSPKSLSELKIPLPPLAEQKRIAEILDKADEIKRKREQTIAKLDQLAQSIFVEMFGERKSNRNFFELCTLRKLTDIATGSTPSRNNNSYMGGDINWVKTTEVDGRIINDTEEKLTLDGLRSIRGKLHPIDSIIVAMYGQGKTRGRVAILAIEAACNQACGVIRPNKSIYNTKFMFWQLKIAYFDLRALGRGGNQENLNLNLLGDFEVMLPPLALQEQFANRIEKLEQLKADNVSALALHKQLFASLQHQAFTGQLSL